jgi:hypothetical protein
MAVRLQALPKVQFQQTPNTTSSTPNLLCRKNETTVLDPTTHCTSVL